MLSSLSAQIDRKPQVYQYKYVEKAVDYIEKNLFESIGMKDIAAHAKVSCWYLQRLFRLFTGYSMMGYLRARRMSEAACELLENQEIIDVAVAHGYGSQQAFSRAFRSFFGLAPNQFRLLFQNRLDHPVLGAKMLAPYRSDLTAPIVSQMYRQKRAEPVFVEQGGFDVMGVGTNLFVGQMDPSRGVRSWVNDYIRKEDEVLISNSWTKFYLTGGDKLLSKHGGFGVGFVDGFWIAPDTRHRYIAGSRCVDQDVLPGTEVKHIPKGSFAHFSHTGPLSDLCETLIYIYRIWFPRSGLSFDLNSAELCYTPPHYDGETGSMNLELYIPVIDSAKQIQQLKAAFAA